MAIVPMRLVGYAADGKPKYAYGAPAGCDDFASTHPMRLVGLAADGKPKFVYGGCYDDGPSDDLVMARIVGYADDGKTKYAYKGNCCEAPTARALFLFGYGGRLASLRFIDPLLTGFYNGKFAIESAPIGPWPYVGGIDYYVTDGDRIYDEEDFANSSTWTDVGALPALTLNDYDCIFMHDLTVATSQLSGANLDTWLSVGGRRLIITSYPYWYFDFGIPDWVPSASTSNTFFNTLLTDIGATIAFNTTSWSMNPYNDPGINDYSKLLDLYGTSHYLYSDLDVDDAALWFPWFDQSASGHIFCTKVINGDTIGVDYINRDVLMASERFNGSDIVLAGTSGMFEEFPAGAIPNAYQPVHPPDSDNNWMSPNRLRRLMPSFYPVV